MLKIDKKIVGYKVVTKEEEKTEQLKDQLIESFLLMNEDIKRPDVLFGSTYKIKHPMEEHAVYITINDMLLNEGTSKEHRVPYEVFINCKNNEHFQWVLALTRVISAVFRKGGNIKFLVDELKDVTDGKGGYRLKGGLWVKSLVGHIGLTIEEHLKTLGIIDVPKLDQATIDYINSKKEEIKMNDSGTGSLCPKCGQMSVIMSGGCNLCTECGDSKCG